MVNYTKKDHKKLKKSHKKRKKSDKKDIRHYIKTHHSKKVKRCYSCGKISRKDELIKATFKGKKRHRCPACLRLLPEYPKI